MVSLYMIGVPEALVWGFLRGLLIGIGILLLIWGAAELATWGIPKLTKRGRKYVELEDAPLIVSHDFVGNESIPEELEQREEILSGKR